MMTTATIDEEPNDEEEDDPVLGVSATGSGCEFTTVVEAIEADEIDGMLVRKSEDGDEHSSTSVLASTFTSASSCADVGDSGEEVVEVEEQDGKIPTTTCMSFDDEFSSIIDINTREQDDDSDNAAFIAYKHTHTHTHTHPPNE